MSIERSYRHILWDWNGTLLNDVDLCSRLLNRLLDHHGLPRVSRDAYRRTLAFPIREYYRNLGFDFDRTPFEELGARFMDMYRREWRDCSLQPGAREALAAAAEEAIPQSILSATEIGLLREGVAHFGIGPSFVRLAALDNHYAAGKIELGRDLIRELERIAGEEPAPDVHVTQD